MYVTHHATAALVRAQMLAKEQADLQAAHGSSFQTQVLPLHDGEAGSMWRRAFRKDDRWAVMEVVRRPGSGDDSRHQQIAIEHCSFSQAVQHLLGWEALQMAEGLQPVAGGDAAALGFRHVRLFLAREGLVPDDAGMPRRYDAEADAVEARGSFRESDIAAARRFALPRRLSAAAPVELAAVRPASPLLDYSLIRKDGSVDPAPANAHKDRIDNWVANEKKEYALNWLMERANTEEPQALGALIAGDRMGHHYSGFELAHIVLRALAVKAPQLAALALHMGADFQSLASRAGEDVKLGDGYSAYNASSTWYSLGSKGKSEAVELLLELGLPPQSRTAREIFSTALRNGITETAMLLAPHMDLLRCVDRTALDSITGSAPLLQVMLQHGLPLEDMIRGRHRCSAAHYLAAQLDDSPLAVAIGAGLDLPVPADGTPSLIAHAVRHGATGCARRLLVGTYVDALGDATLGRDLVQALDQGNDTVAALILDMRPAAAAALEDYTVLAKAAALPPGQVFQRFGTDPRWAEPFAAALLAHGSAEALRTAFATGTPPAAAVFARAPDAVARALVASGREDCAAAAIAAGGIAQEATLAALAAEAHGCVLAATAARGSLTLVQAVAGAVPRLLPEGDTALHRLAGDGSAELLGAALHRLPQHSLDMPRQSDGATALILATRAGKLDAVTLLRDAGADLALRDKAGRSARDYALLLGDEAVAKAVEPPLPVPASRKRGWSWGF